MSKFKDDIFAWVNEHEYEEGSFAVFSGIRVNEKEWTDDYTTLVLGNPSDKQFIQTLVCIGYAYMRHRQDGTNGNKEWLANIFSMCNRYVVGEEFGDYFDKQENENEK